METKNNNCKTLRTWLKRSMSKHFMLNSPWAQNHIANCPKCQKRLASLEKVDLALMMIKSQIHSKKLLAKANQQAISVLSNSLADNPKVVELKNAEYNISILRMLSKYNGKLINAAACLLMFFMIKFGITNSFENFQETGEKAVKKYYANHLGDDLADDIFSS